MALAHLRMLIHELLNKCTFIVPEEAPLIFLVGRCAMCISKNGKDTKQTRQITRKMNFITMEKSERYTILIDMREV